MPQPTEEQRRAHDRAEAWRRLRAEEIDAPARLRPKAAEKFAVHFGDEIIPRLTTPRSALFPFIGRITSGGGFALGPGYRLLDVAGRRTGPATARDR